MTTALPDIALEPMSRASLQAQLDFAVGLEQASGLPPWNAENFLAELPEKWLHSRWIMLQNNLDAPVGYAIVSRKAPDNLHLHRLVVNPMGRGYGGLALRLLIADCAPHSRFMTVYTIPDAVRAAYFYERAGFVRLMRTETNLLLLMNMRDGMGHASR